MDVVLVEWLDAAASSGWRPRGEEPPEPVTCYTVGHLLKHVEGAYISLVMSVNLNEMADITTIPESAIISVTPLAARQPLADV